MRWSGLAATILANDLTREILSFALIGGCGFLIDSSITFGLAHGAGLSPAVARAPAFLAAMLANFLLNRAITFRDAEAPVLAAFGRYALVSVGAWAVNYGVYVGCVYLAPMIGVDVTPARLPLFIAIGVAAAMVPSFIGLKIFAFRKSV